METRKEVIKGTEGGVTGGLKLAGKRLAYQVTLTEVFAESMADNLLVPLSVHLTGESSTVRPPALL